jgi:hypothetical protein
MRGERDSITGDESAPAARAEPELLPHVLAPLPDARAPSTFAA